MLINVFKYLLLTVALAFSTQASAQLKADFSADITSGCVPFRVQFTNLSSGNPDRYEWKLGEGTVSTFKDPLKTYLFPGKYDITLTIYKGSETATIVKSAYINANSVPVIDFSATPTSGCSPFSVQFTDKSTSTSGPLVSWKWDFGDGNLGTGQNPVHVYQTPGDFKVTLTAKNSAGCENNASKENYIKVNELLKADFDPFYSPSCLPNVTVDFKDKSIGTNIVSWFWEFGDGATSTNQNPKYTYTTKGSYDVKLTVVNALGCKNTYTYAAAVNVANLQAGFTVPGLVCAGAGALFVNASTPTTKVDSVVWRVSDGTVYRTSNLSKSFKNPGTYTVTQEVYQFGCVSILSKTITVEPRPQALFTSTGTTACKAPLTVQFTNTSVNGKVVGWDFGNGKKSTAEAPAVVYDTIGSYTVKLIVINPTGCYDTIVASRYVNVLPPSIDSIRGLPYNGCSPFTGTFVPRITTPEPITSYRWDFGDGSNSDVANPTKSYTAFAVYRVTLSIVTQNGCVATDTQFVRLSPKPKADFSGGPPVVCPSIPAVFKNLSTGDQTGWRWEFGDGGVSFDKDPSYRYNNIGNMDVRLITYNYGCADTIVKPKYIYVDPPIAKFVDSVSCADQATHYFTNNSIGATYWKWTFGDGTTSEEWSPIHKYADTGVYYLSLYVNNGTCEHTSTRAVYVLQQKAYVVPVYKAGCKESEVELTATGPNTSSNRILFYEWRFPNEPVVTTDTNYIERFYSDTTRFMIGLKIVDLNGCADSILQEIKIQLPEAKANFGPSQQFVCAGDLVVFTDSSQVVTTNPVKSWKWTLDFENNPDKDTIQTKAPLAHRYFERGVYDVKLVIVDKFGCTDSIVKKAAVIVSKPIADYESPDTLVCLNTPVNFFNHSTSTGPTSWKWDFGDGTTTGNEAPVKVYTVEGKYTISLMVTDGLGCKDTLTKPKYIIAANARAVFEMDDSFSTCPPLIVQFTNKSASNFVNYWDLGNGNFSDLINPAHTFTSSGDFIVKLKVTGKGGCTDSTSRVVSIKGPKGEIFYDPLVACAPHAVRFSSKAINTKSYVWDFNDGVSVVTNVPNTQYVYRGAGKYVPRVLLEDGKGCVIAIIGTDTIITNDTPKIVAGPNPIVCLGQSTTLNATGGLTYNWAPNPALSCLDCATTIATPAAASIYRVFGTDSNGCIGSDTALVRIMPPGILSHSLGDTLCIGESVQLRAGGFDRYSWTPTAGLNNPSISNPLARPAATTNYLVTATDSLGCFTSTATIPVVVFPIPTFNIVETLIKSNVGTTVPLKSVASTDVTSYRWTPASGLDCATCPEPFVTVINKIKYTAEVRNDGGCAAQDQISIEPTCTGESVFVPNTFSPNGDGKNDIFYPRGSGVSSIKFLQIYTRWGELVYERKGLVLNDPTAGWNGTYKGQTLTPDVYVYMMELICGNNQTFTMKGNVTLLK